MTGVNHLILLGVGQVGRAVVAQAHGTRSITGTTRDPRKIFHMVESGITPLIMPLPSAEVFASVCQDADVLVSFPPDGSTDKILAPACSIARRVIYISSTGVYGNTEGTIDDTTPADQSAPGMESRLQAEQTWSAIGAIVLRVPGIYGPDAGLHLSLKNGKYRMPGNGERHSSRIHVEDLATIILTAFAAQKLLHQTYVIGDCSPCSQKEIVSWLCEKIDAPPPDSIPLAEAHRTLRGNRRIDPTRLLNELGLSLKYPDYKQGYAALLNAPSE